MANGDKDRTSRQRRTETGRTTNSTKTTRQLTLKERNLIDLLPAHNWSVIQAGLAAGYKPSYANTMLLHRAKNDITLSMAIEHKRQDIAKELARSTGWTIDWWRQKQEEVLSMSLADNDKAAANAALASIGKHLGVYEQAGRQATGQPTIVIHMPQSTSRLVDSIDPTLPTLDVGSSSTAAPGASGDDPGQGDDDDNG